MLDENALTTLFKTAVGPAAPPAVQWLVGIGEAPKDGGWSQGTAGDGTFKPYVTVIWGGAAPVFAPRMGTYDRDWRANFTVKSYGASYDQLGRIKQAWRSRLEAFVAGSGTTFGTPAWKVVGLDWGPLGPSNPDKSTSPYTWGAQDSVGLLCSNT